MVDPTKRLETSQWVARHVGSDYPLPKRIAKLMSFFVNGGEFMNEVFLSHCESGAMFVERLGFDTDVQNAVRYLWERWDGRSYAYRLRGAATPVAARVLHLAQVMEVGHRVGGPPVAANLAKDRRGKDFDPDVVDAFLEAQTAGTLWEAFDVPSAKEMVLELRPVLANDAATEERIDNMCSVLADFIDIKTPWTWGHSRSVADTAEGIARQLGVDEPERTVLRRAALVHDLGNVMVPCTTMEKDGALTLNEREQVELHPYYTDRILGRVEPLRALAPIASAHHERFDGTGYHRQVGGEQLSLGQHILGIANQYVSLVQGGQRTHRQAMDEIAAGVDMHHPADVFKGLGDYLEGRPARPRVSHTERTASLSDREVEVIRYLANGMRNKEIAAAMVISEKTVERHLENIYNKLDVTSRTSAVVYGVQHGLVDTPHPKRSGL